MARGRHWGRIAATGLLLAVAAGAGGLWLYRDQERAADCERIEAATAARHDNDPVHIGGPTAVILGDSWAAGSFLDDPRGQAWSTLLGERRGWTTYVDAIGLTGYTNGGYCGGEEFAARAERVLERRPAVVVIEGGLNDDDADPADVRVAADELLAAFAAVPEVYVVGPPDTPARANEAAIDQALAEAADDAHRQYISALRFELAYLEDGLHLTEEGHQQFAVQLADAVSGLQQ